MRGTSTRGQRRRRSYAKPQFVASIAKSSGSISCCIATLIATGFSCCFCSLTAALLHDGSVGPSGFRVLADLIFTPARSRRYFTNSTGSRPSPRSTSRRSCGTAATCSRASYRVAVGASRARGRHPPDPSCASPTPDAGLSAGPGAARDRRWGHRRGGGASTTRGGASTTRGGASTTRGGASTTRGGASTTRGGASTTRGGASTTRGGASLSSGWRRNARSTRPLRSVWRFVGLRMRHEVLAMVFLRGAMRRWAHDVAHDAQECAPPARRYSATLAKDAPQTVGQCDSSSSGCAIPLRTCARRASGRVGDHDRDEPYGQHGPGLPVAQGARRDEDRHGLHAELPRVAAPEARTRGSRSVDSSRRSSRHASSCRADSVDGRKFRVAHGPGVAISLGLS